jgi:ComEC/Rec2-related protein
VLAPFIWLRQRAPCAGLFLAAAIGILAADGRWSSWPLWAGATAVAALLAMCVRSTALACFTLLFGFAFWHAFRTDHDPGFRWSLRPNLSADEHTFTLVVSSDPKPDAFRSLQRFTGIVTSVDSEATRFLVFAECSGDPFAYGDELITQGKFILPAKPMNPGEFDFNSYLRRKNVYLTFRSLRGVPAEIVGRGKANPFVATALDMRHRLANLLQTGLEDDPEVAETVQGMVLGARAETSSELKQIFQDTGTVHLFAASGLQVGLFGGIAWKIIRSMRFTRRSVALALVPLLALYCAITGFYPATVRATVMAVLLTIGASLERPVTILNSLAASGLLILAHDTQQLFQLGFQLSFAAVLGIVVCVEPLAHWLSRPFRIDPFLPIQLLNPAQKIGHRIAFHGCELMSLSFVCWLATLPILILRDHRVSTVSVLANVLVVPIASLVMTLAAVTLAATPLSNWLASCFNNTTWLLTKMILFVLHAVTAIPYHSVNIGGVAPPGYVTALLPRSGHMFHAHLAGRDLLFAGNSFTSWNLVARPYLEWRGVNRLNTLIIADAQRSRVPDEASKWFSIDQSVRLEPRQSRLSALQGKIPSIQIVPCHETAAAESLQFIVALGAFRMLILSEVDDRLATELPDVRADVVYCMHTSSRNLRSILSKLTPRVAIFTGTKAELGIRSAPDAPICFYLKENGAVTTAVVGKELVVTDMAGHQARLRSLNR